MLILAVLLLIIIVPMILYYTGIASSAAAGTGVVGALLIILRVETLAGRDFFPKAVDTDHRMTPTVWVLLVLTLVVGHEAVAWTYQPLDVQRFCTSLVPLVVTLLAGCCFGLLLEDTDDRHLDRAIRACFAFFCVCALGGVLGFAPPSPRLTTKPVFPFNEPSHLAIIFTPFLIFCCIRARGFARYAFWFAGVTMAASLQNLTLVAGCAIAALAFVRGLAAIPMFMLAIGAATVVDLSYYLSRFDLLSDNPNLSVLTYLQGWQLVVESFGRSTGWGLGFQQLGVHGTDVPAAQIIYEQTLESENLLDGAFGFAKIVSEFGVFGLLLSWYFARIWWRSIRMLRHFAAGAACSSSELFALCLIAGYFVEIFVRGAGYFTGSGLMTTGAVWLVTRRTRGPRQIRELPGPGGDVRWI